MERITVACIALVALTCCFYETEALKCYHGTGTLTAAVVEPDCKVCMKSGASGLGLDASIRTCVVNGTCTENSAGAVGFSAGTFCCSDKDLCNGASTVYISSILSLGALLILALRFI
jgi:hypothetical protein